MKKIAISFLVIFLLLQCGGNKTKPISTTKPFDFTLEQIGGGKITLSEQKGKVVLVDFWATWCPPCRAAIPHLVKMYDTYKEQGLIVLGISLDQKKEEVPPFVKDNNITYPILYGDNQVDKQFNIQYLPTVVIIDKKGDLIHRIEGFNEKNEKIIEDIIIELIKK